MLPPDNDLRANFIEVLKEIAALMSIAYEQTGPVPDDHPLAQAGLESGGEIVLDYVDHNEAGLAFEHLAALNECAADMQLLKDFESQEAVDYFRLGVISDVPDVGNDM